MSESLSEKEKEAVNRVWKNLTDDIITEEAKEAVGWDSKSEFVADIFRFGMDTFTKAPKRIVKKRVNDMLDIFQESEEDKDDNREEGKMFA